jgi:hypothetical protein
MLSIGLWPRYVNITITILDIIHRPVFYLKLNSIDLSSSNIEHIKSPLRAQQVNAIWRWYINIAITILDIIQIPVLFEKKKKKDFSDTGLCCPSSGGTYSDGPNRKS